MSELTQAQREAMERAFEALTGLKFSGDARIGELHRDDLVEFFLAGLRYQDEEEAPSCEAFEFLRFLAGLDALDATAMRRKITLTTVIRRAQGILRRWPAQPAEPSEAEVEAAARVLHPTWDGDAHRKIRVDPPRAPFTLGEAWRNEARAALKAAREVGGDG